MSAALCQLAGPAEPPESGFLALEPHLLRQNAIELIESLVGGRYDGVSPEAIERRDERLRTLALLHRV